LANHEKNPGNKKVTDLSKHSMPVFRRQRPSGFEKAAIFPHHLLAIAPDSPGTVKESKMTTTKMSITAAVAAAVDLRAIMRGKVVMVGDRDYSRACQVWNGAVDHRPAVVAICETVEDVQAAVRIAQTHQLPLSVRGGGHDWAGRAIRHNGLVIDLTDMRNVEVDAEAMVATVAGGATGADLTAATSPHGLAAVTANVGAVGVAGFLLGGGYGPLTTRFGLGLDNLLGAEVVLADGRVVRADAAQNHELFWALRGGGGNFGVVTSMRIGLHLLDEVLAGILLFPWDQAHAVLTGYAKMMASAPDELSVLAGVFSGPDGSPAVLLGPVWSGEPREGEKFMARLEKLGSPAFSQIASMGYADLLNMYNAKAEPGRHYALQTRWLAQISPEVVSTVVEAGERMSSPFSFVVIHHFHGPGSKVAPDATAFALRKDHFLMEIGAAWDVESAPTAPAHRSWLYDVSARIAPFSLPGGYPNFLTQDAPAQVASAYGENARRLCELKRQFDPGNVFSSTTPLPL
jgi:FAD/FMN-containing dehydrogenase